MCECCLTDVEKDRKERQQLLEQYFPGRVGLVALHELVHGRMDVSEATLQWHPRTSLNHPLVQGLQPGARALNHAVSGVRLRIRGGR